ncbi:BglG family transcription antiterminator [Fictibacillus terranigra]|uniref:BglG family transcription antiterminator n=1 Tax=Fictibacillus terranigra TaxID=3058424 RepID=A0ABT8EDC0_9BACL|nr:BglG family transcription antiterminator [Fictibacillus sp. CENA-BCM004]MDN4075930.1 BglG family transcription antiterminator [Fictibacillus sp. CENA-BCM004]
MMSLDQRSTAMLSHLSQAQGYISVDELIEKFNVSKRTIYYDIEKINGWLSDNDLKPIQHVRTAGFHLEDKDAALVPKKLERLQTWHYEFSIKERKAWLAIYLMARDAPLYLEDLMEKIRVSRNTTIEDIKQLKEELVRFNLHLSFDRKDGYVIGGDEDDKRKAIAYYLQHVLPQQSWRTLLSQLPSILSDKNDGFGLFDCNRLSAIQSILTECETKLNIQFTDEFLHHLSFRLLLFGKRLAYRKYIYINQAEKDVLRETKEYDAAQHISHQLSILFQVDFPEDEVVYITKHLLSSRIQFSEDLLAPTHFKDTKLLSEVVSNMVTDFQRYSCVFFENREEVENHLLLHIKPAYYRVKYELEVENNAVNSIMEKYHDIYQISSKVICHLEAAAGKAVSKNETALIAMHFGGWMEKIGAKPAHRRRALLVCTNGIGTSRLLLHQLEGLFSTVDIIGCYSLRDYEKKPIDSDFIISTINLPEKDKPVFVVSPVLTDSEKERLLQKVNALIDAKQQRSSVQAMMSMIKKYADVFEEERLHKELTQYIYKPTAPPKDVTKPELSELLPLQHIQMEERVPDWKSAIRLASQPLRKADSITASYIEVMMNNLEKMGPYVVVSPGVAIPHARPEDGVKRLGMSLLRIKNSIPFTDQGTHRVHLVIVLAAIDGDTHLKALSQLTAMMNEPGIKETLFSTNSPEKIYELMQAYSD